MLVKLGRITALLFLSLFAAAASFLPLPEAVANPAITQDAQLAPIPLETHADPFDYRSAVSQLIHVPLARAAKPWKLCAVFPHIKDEYWISVDYGMAEEARRLGVSLSISETGGYRSVEAQAERLRDCLQRGADAAILGSVTYDGRPMLDAITDVSTRIPVIAAVNDVGSRQVAVKVGVSWREMGERLGAYLSQQFPAADATQNVVLATGPREAGWVSFLAEGISKGLQKSSLSLIGTGWADTDAQEQFGIAEDLLERNANIDCFIGSAPAVEAVVSLLRTRAGHAGMKVAATYYTQAVRRGMMRGRILAAPFDDPALQGRISIEYAVRAIEHTVDHRQIGPPIRLVTSKSLPPANALAPADFHLVFEIK